MKIRKLSVEKLWKKYTFSIDFNEQVTILIGKNGSGKSTILNLLDDLLSHGENKNSYKFDKIKITFDNDESIEAQQKRFKSTVEIEKIDDMISRDEIKALLKRIEVDLIKRVDNKKSNELLPISLRQEIDTQKNISYLFLSTFDMEIKDKELHQKHYDDSHIKTELDVFLNDLITKFKFYQLRLKEKVEKVQEEFDSKLEIYASSKDLHILKDKLLEKNKNISDIYHHRDLFKNILNELFGSTSKTIKLNENNSIIFNISEEEFLTPYQLSSGEKQILIIMLNVMLLENKPTILLMDEPEISLHVEWQNVFIETLLALNSNLQLVITTHSPALVSKGYRNSSISLDNFSIKK